jgi:hypothetical protein
MVSINLFQTQFTNDEWDAIERALITLMDVATMRSSFVQGISGEDLQETKRLAPHAETALLKIELGNT